MRTGHKKLQRHWVLYLPRDIWKYVSHALLPRLSRKIPLTNHLDGARVLLTTFKCTWTYDVYTAPTRNTPTSTIGISWWTALQGTILMGFIRPKTASSNQHASNFKSRKMSETRLKLFSRIMQEKTNFLSREQAVWIGNTAQNSNTQLEQLLSTTVLLNWALQHASSLQGPCSRMPIWMQILELNW